MQARPSPPHTEDWHIHPSRRRFIRTLSADERWRLLDAIEDDSVEAIFGAPVRSDAGHYVSSGEGRRSLGTITPRRIFDVNFREYTDRGRWEYRLSFEDQAGVQYRLGITDLSYRYLLDHARDNMAFEPSDVAAKMRSFFQRARRVSLRIGLARHWERHPDRCYLQITGIYTEPDYLRGRCYADFWRPPHLEELDLSSVPF
jgi:hypothetical protein